MTPEQEQELRQLLEPRPDVSLNGLEGIPNDAYRTTPFGSSKIAPYEPIRPEQGYQSQRDPMLDARPDLSGWADDPSQGGLGLASRPQPGQDELPYYRGPFGGVLERLGLTTAVSPLDKYAAQQEFPGITLTPQQSRTLGNQYLDLQLASQRQARATQMAQLEETKRQNQWEDLFKVIGNEKLSPPQAIELLKGMAKQNPFAAEAAQTINDKMIGDFKTWQDYLPRKPEEYEQGLKAGKLKWPQIAAEIDAAKAQGMEETKALAKETAQQRKLQGLLTKFRDNPDAMTDTELDIIDQHQKQRQERALKIQGLQVGLRGATADVKKKENAPSEVYSGVGPGGESVTGIYDPRKGSTTEMSGVPASSQKVTTMSSPAIEAQVDSRTMLEQLSQLEKAYKADYVGPIDNFIASLKEKAPGVFGPIPRDEGEFRKKVNQVLLTAKKLNIGTAQSAAETESFVKAYMDLGQNDTVFESAIQGLREMTRTSLQVRSRLMTEIASGQRKPLSIPERSMQLAALVNVKGFATNEEEARQIARDTLLEEIKLGLVKGY